MMTSNDEKNCTFANNKEKTVFRMQNKTMDISNPVDIFFRLKSDDASLQFKDWSLSK